VTINISSIAVVTKPPYEVTETGWGEFEIVIKIYFNDPNEKSVSIIGGPVAQCCQRSVNYSNQGSKFVIAQL
jgi:hypothetical protein